MRSETPACLAFALAMATSFGSMSMQTPRAPAFAAAMIEPSPNRYRKLDIPILPGGVVEGTVRWAAGSPGAASRSVSGVAIVMKHEESGEQRVITTFTDGSFYAIGVRPGEWQIRVDSKCQSLLKASAKPVAFTIKASAEGATVSGLELVLE